jgi:hypothetical protein
MVGMTFATVVITVFLLAFASLRWIGLLAMALLIYLFPLVTVGLLVLGAIAFYLLKLK